MHPHLLFASAFLVALACASFSSAQVRTATELVQLATQNSPDLEKAIRDTFPAADLESGVAWSGHLHYFFFAIRASSRPALFIDDAPGPAMLEIPSTGLWYAVAQITPLGALHGFRYQLNGKEFGGSNNLPAYSELSYLMPGVKQGTLSPQLSITSKIYDGMTSDYWIYEPAGYDARVPAALMVFQDGSRYTARDHGNQVLNVIDNLIALKKIPYMICIFINRRQNRGPSRESHVRTRQSPR